MSLSRCIARVLLGVATLFSGIQLRAGQIDQHQTNAAPATKSQDWWRTKPGKLVPVAPAKSAAAAGKDSRPTFNWRQLESTDYREYVARLRAVDCPEQTIQDIVCADVIQAYAPRRNEAVAARYQDFKFWKADPEAAGKLARQRRELDEELGNTLHTLLGGDFLVPSTSPEWRQAELEQRLGFLPVEKRTKAVALLLRHTETDLQFGQLANDHRRNEDREELRRIMADYDQKRATLKEILMPEEVEMVELSASWTAHNLHRAMTHFDPTEAEFRSIFRVWQEHDEHLAHLHAAGEPDPGDLQEGAFEKLKGLLGEARYGEYRSTWWE